MMASTLKFVMICEYGIGPSWELGMRYQFWYGVTSIVTDSGSFLVARHAQMEGLLSFAFRMWAGISITMQSVLEHCSCLSEYYVPREWGVELSECGWPCY